MSARVAVVDGVRTPFARRGGAFRHLGATELGALCVAELVQRSGLDADEVAQLVFGRVIPDARTPNIAREVALRAGLPFEADGYAVCEGCISGHRAVVCAAEAIASGSIACAVAGGAESVSAVPVTLEEPVDVAARHASASALRLHVPSLEEPSTGARLGDGAERMAKENRIDRERQDAYAYRSNARAQRAWDAGLFDDEVMRVHVPPAYEETVTADRTVRRDSIFADYVVLEPLFDPRHGSLTEANGAPLADGASALLLMRESHAKLLGYSPLGYLRSHAFVAVDPREQVLIGPVHAIPLALERAGIALADVGVVDLHETFAAQVLSVLDRLGASGVGAIDEDRLNPSGGSIALGHPLAATGARQITQALHEMRRRRAELGLVSAASGGGLAVAMVLEAA